MIGRLVRLLIAALAIAAIVGGCGGGGGGTVAGESTTAAAKANDTTSEASPSKGAEKAKGEGAGAETGGETTTGAGAAPKAAFVKQVNAICKRATDGAAEEIEAYEKQHESASAGTLAQGTVAVFFPRVEKEIEEIRAVAAESGEEAQMEAYIEALEAGLANSQEPTSIIEIAEQFKAADKLAAAYGFKDCLVA